LSLETFLGKVRRMRGIWFILILTTLTVPAFASDSRSVNTLTRGWRYWSGDPVLAADPSFDETKWEKISIPHSWPAEVQGTGWYRRRVFVSEDRRGHAFFLRFEAVNQSADVFFNGQKIGHHDGGYTAFAFDVTNEVKFDAANWIAVRVNNERNPDVAPVSADYTFFGGIYRAVQWIETEPTHISLLDAGSSGVSVIPVVQADGSARVAVRVVVENEGSSQAEIPVTVRIGALQEKQSVTLAAHETRTVPFDFAVVNPHLWDGRADPFLYEVCVRAGSGDEVRQNFGIRTFSVDRDRGLILNGRPLALNGVNMHQDWDGKGWALGSKERRTNIRILRELGVNVVRLAHYPHARETLDLLDREGIIVWSEIPLINQVTPSQAFAASTKRQLIEEIRQRLNHPSIFFWSLFNEIRSDPIQLIPQLNELAHREDPSRLTVGASNQAFDHPLNQITDVIAINRYDGWYYGAASDIGARLDAARSKISIPLGLSEFGAGASLTQHEDTPAKPRAGGRFHPEEYQCLFHETYEESLKTRPFVWGQFVWNLFDFSSIMRHEGDRDGINDKGLVSYDRSTRKDAFYFFQAIWTQLPMVHITDRRFVKRAGTIDIKIYSNASTVRLSVNGRALEGASHRDVVFEWKKVALDHGRNLVRASASGVPDDEVEWIAP
jgi:beta-galactosidase